MVTIIHNGKHEYITKARLCLLLQNDRIKISSDISKRFIFKKSFKIRDINQLSVVWESSIIARGEWIVVDECGVFFAGMVINFQKRDEKTKSKRVYNHDELILEEKASQNISVLLQPVSLIIQKTFSSAPAANKYFLSTKYVCHIKNDEIDLRMCLKEIMVHYSNFLKKPH